MAEAAAEQSNEAPNTPPAESEAEVRARRLGWVSKDEFKGEPEHWRPAEEFLERGTRILPLLQRDNDRLHKRLGEVEALLKETREASKDLVEFTSKAEERAYDRAKREIQAKIEQAAANADPATVRAEIANLDNLNEQHRKPAPKTETRPEPKIDPEIGEWISREKWYSPQQPALYAFATETYGELEREKPGMSTAERLAETKRLTAEKFPEKFGITKTERETTARVAAPSGGNGAARKPAKSYENLPPEAKAACDRYVRTIQGYTREKYVANYDWDA